MKSKTRLLLTQDIAGARLAVLSTSWLLAAKKPKCKASLFLLPLYRVFLEDEAKPSGMKTGQSTEEEIKFFLYFITPHRNGIRKATAAAGYEISPLKPALAISTFKN